MLPAGLRSPTPISAAAACGRIRRRQSKRWSRPRRWRGMSGRRTKRKRRPEPPRQRGSDRLTSRAKTSSARCVSKKVGTAPRRGRGEAGAVPDHGSARNMAQQQYAGRRVRGICGIALLECRTLVGESTHAAVASKIMVERTIFLDKDDDMLDVSQSCASRRSGACRSTSAAASMQKSSSELCCTSGDGNFQYFSAG